MCIESEIESKKWHQSEKKGLERIARARSGLHICWTTYNKPWTSKLMDLQLDPSWKLDTRYQLSSTDLVVSTMSNSELKFKFVGNCKILSFSLFCLSLFPIFKSELIWLIRSTSTIQSIFPFKPRIFLIHGSLQYLFISTIQNINLTH